MPKPLKSVLEYGSIRGYRNRPRAYCPTHYFSLVYIRGRPHREWSDDIEQWCGTTLQELSHAALDRQR